MKQFSRTRVTLSKNVTIWPNGIYIWHVRKDCFSEMSTISHTQHPSFCKSGHKHYCNKPNRLLAGHNNTKVNAIAILCCSPIHVIKHPETSGMLMVFSIFCLWRERIDISAPNQKLTDEFVGVFLLFFYVVHGNFLPCNFFGHCTSNEWWGSFCVLLKKLQVQKVWGGTWGEEVWGYFF